MVEEGCIIDVAPFVGVWIEMSLSVSIFNACHVAPFVGVWIEIRNRPDENSGKKVAPFVGVWIEIFTNRVIL